MQWALNKYIVTIWSQAKNAQFALIIKRQENVSLSREVTFVYVIRRNQKEREIAGICTHRHPDW